MSIMKTLKSYINIPFSFKGVSEASAVPGFFANIARSHKGVAAQVKAYDQMEHLLSHVAEEMKKMTDWLAPSCVTMDVIESTVDALLNDTADWELNYKILKQISKESDTIGSEIQIDNITISLTRMKAQTALQMNTSHSTHHQRAAVPPSTRQRVNAKGTHLTS